MHAKLRTGRRVSIRYRVSLRRPPWLGGQRVDERAREKRLRLETGQAEDTRLRKLGLDGVSEAWWRVCCTQD